MATNREGSTENEIDWKWEYLKVTKRCEDLLTMIQEQDRKYRSLSMRVSRIQGQIRGEEEEPEKEEGPALEAIPRPLTDVEIIQRYEQLKSRV